PRAVPQGRAAAGGRPAPLRGGGGLAHGGGLGAGRGMHRGRGAARRARAGGGTAVRDLLPGGDRRGLAGAGGPVLTRPPLAKTATTGASGRKTRRGGFR